MIYSGSGSGSCKKFRIRPDPDPTPDQDPQHCISGSESIQQQILVPYFRFRQHSAADFSSVFQVPRAFSSRFLVPYFRFRVHSAADFQFRISGSASIQQQIISGRGFLVISHLLSKASRQVLKSFFTFFQKLPVGNEITCFLRRSISAFISTVCTYIPYLLVSISRLVFLIFL